MRAAQVQDGQGNEEADEDSGRRAHLRQGSNGAPDLLGVQATGLGLHKPSAGVWLRRQVEEERDSPDQLHAHEPCIRRTDCEPGRGCYGGCEPSNGCVARGEVHTSGAEAASARGDVQDQGEDRRYKCEDQCEASPSHATDGAADRVQADREAVKQQVQGARDTGGSNKRERERGGTVSKREIPPVIRCVMNKEKFSHYSYCVSETG